MVVLARARDGACAGLGLPLGARVPLRRLQRLTLQLNPAAAGRRAGGAIPYPLCPAGAPAPALPLTGLYEGCAPGRASG